MGSERPYLIQYVIMSIDACFKGSVTALSWPVELLSGEVYLDLFDMLNDKDYQFSSTDNSMSIDSGNGGNHKQNTPFTVYHCSPCKTLC